MANQFLTISDITKESLRVLKNKLVFSQAVNRSYDSKFGVAGAKIGATVNARKPPRYIGRTGAAVVMESMTETYVPVTLTTQFGVDTAITSADKALSLNDFSKVFIEPAMATIANKIDYDGLQQYKKVHNVVGTAGQISGGSLTQAQATRAIMAANVRLDEEAAPGNDRTALWSPGASGEIVVGLSGLFNPSGTISKIFKEGALGDNILGLSHAASQNIPMHTSGSMAATSTGITVSGAQNGGSVQSNANTAFTISLVASTSKTLKEGDVVTIAGVYAVNPQNRQSTGKLRNFVVRSDVTIGTSATDVSIFPYPVFSGAFQNCYSSSGQFDNSAAVLKLTGGASEAYDQNLVWHKDAFVLATADLELPSGVDQANMAREADAGISVRCIGAFDVRTDQFIFRTDVLYGWATVYPELACRVIS